METFQFSLIVWAQAHEVFLASKGTSRHKYSNTMEITLSLYKGISVIILHSIAVAQLHELPLWIYAWLLNFFCIYY